MCGIGPLSVRDAQCSPVIGDSVTIRGKQLLDCTMLRTLRLCQRAQSPKNNINKSERADKYVSGNYAWHEKRASYLKATLGHLSVQCRITNNLYITDEKTMSENQIIFTKSQVQSNNHSSLCKCPVHRAR
jgi:hypothetical protein